MSKFTLNGNIGVFSICACPHLRSLPPPHPLGTSEGPGQERKRDHPKRAPGTSPRPRRTPAQVSLKTSKKPGQPR
eukprot:3028878-Karenia_brevis.AAC.1